MMIPRRVQGRHRRYDDGRGRGWAMVLVAFVAAGGVVTSVVMSSAGDHDPAPAPAGTGAATGPVAGAATGTALRACETAVARGRDAVAAAQPSYSHWAGHVRAQLDYDAGTATLAQTRERWAATRATADADLADFATARAAFEAVQHGCAAEPVTPQEPGAARQPGPAVADDPAMAQCRAEFDSVAPAVGAARAVVDDWAAHVAMMKGKEHYGADEYGQMWRDMVKAAPADLDRFATASLAMSDDAACPRPL